MENNQPVPPVSPQPPVSEPSVTDYPVAPISAPPNIPPKKDYKKIILIIIGIVIIFVVVLLILLLMNKNRRQPSTQLPIPTPAPTVSVPSSATIPSKQPTFSVLLTLIKGKTTLIPGTDITLTFITRDQPPKDCSDCFSTTQIDMKQNGKLFSLDFVCGGFVGGCTKQIEKEGYIFELTKNLEENSVEMQISVK